MLNERGGRLATTSSSQYRAALYPQVVPPPFSELLAPSNGYRVGDSVQKTPETLSRVQTITNTQRQFKPILLIHRQPYSQAPLRLLNFPRKTRHFCIPKRCLQSPSAGPSSPSRFLINPQKEERQGGELGGAQPLPPVSVPPFVEPDPPTQGGILLKTHEETRSEGSRLKRGPR